MFKELVASKRYSFHTAFADWRDAVRAACQPLLEDGTIEPEYVEAIIGNVEKYGPYIVIAPDICIPHAQEGLGVNDTAVCFMKAEEPVSFSDDGEHDARLFFVLASTDNARHLANLSELSDELSDEVFVEALLQAKSGDDLQKLADSVGE